MPGHRPAVPGPGPGRHRRRRGPTSRSPPAATGCARSARSRRSGGGSGRGPSTSWWPRPPGWPQQGARELVLVSENTTSWGKDLPGRVGEPAADAAARAGRGRRHRAAAADVPAARRAAAALLEAMASIPAVAPYFDLSLQHVSAPGADPHGPGRLARALRRSSSAGSASCPARGLPVQLHPRVPGRDRAGRRPARGLPRRAPARLGRAVPVQPRGRHPVRRPATTRSTRTSPGPASSASRRCRSAPPTAPPRRTSDGTWTCWSRNAVEVEGEVVAGGRPLPPRGARHRRRGAPGHRRRGRAGPARGPHGPRPRRRPRGRRPGRGGGRHGDVHGGGAADAPRDEDARTCCRTPTRSTALAPTSCSSPSRTGSTCPTGSRSCGPCSCR